MTNRDETHAMKHGYDAVNWHIRSLIAAAGLAVCAFFTAISATASASRADVARAAEREIASEAALVAEFADFLAEETAQARVALGSPRLKPAEPVSTVVAGADLSAFV
ncbi:MAG: hypothetical protein AAGJ87_17270, partial [Pseudomonadota bacterium]